MRTGLLCCLALAATSTPALAQGWPTPYGQYPPAAAMPGYGGYPPGAMQGYGGYPAAPGPAYPPGAMPGYGGYPVAPGPAYPPQGAAWPGSTPVGTWNGPAPAYPIPSYPRNATRVFPAGGPDQPPPTTLPDPAPETPPAKDESAPPPAASTEAAPKPALVKVPPPLPIKSGAPCTTDCAVEEYGHEQPMPAPIAKDEPTLPRDCVRFSIGYLQSFLRPAPLHVPIVTTGVPTANSFGGVIGQPGTQVLFGNETLRTSNAGLQSGLEVWLDDERTTSFEMTGFFLFPQHKTFAQGSDASGDVLIARPARDAIGGGEIAFLVAAPGVSIGRTDVDARTEFFGADISGRHHFNFTENLIGSLSLGGRYLNLNEHLDITDHVQPLVTDVFTFAGQPVGPGQMFSDHDLFRTTNQFYGTQLGSQLRWQQSRFYIEGFGKVGVGATVQRTAIDGSSLLQNANGTTQTAVGGIFAQSSNIGTQSHTVFGVVPEAGLNLGIDLFSNLRLKMGYSFLYWNSVVRPGDQIDRTVNTHLAPTAKDFGTPGGPQRPIANPQDSTFWVNSLNIGLELHY